MQLSVVELCVCEGVSAIMLHVSHPQEYNGGGGGGGGGSGGGGGGGGGGVKLRCVERIVVMVVISKQRDGLRTTLCLEQR